MFWKRSGRSASANETDEASGPRLPPPRGAGEGLPPVSTPAIRRIRRPRGGLLSMLSGFTTVALVLAAAGTFGFMALVGSVDKPGPLTQDKVVFIPKNTGTSEISELLTREGVIAEPTLFELYAYINRRKGQLKAGEFLFKAGVTIDDVIDTLIQGKAILHAITIPEGLTSEQIMQRVRDNDILTGSYDDTPREGSLMPDTYKFERGTTRQQFVNLMQAAQREALNKIWTRRSPDLAIRTPQELVILASIVEKETGRPDERPRVASVFLNRLQRRMKLQSDPTIVYGIVGGKGTLGRGILRSEIEKATPYNTYVIEGLPPGPIANPGRAALEAVANPLKTKDVFFVADGTGGHAFAETLDQHQRNVARWRDVERSRGAAAPGAASVDRAEPPQRPETRTDYQQGSPSGQSASVGGADAVEGTDRDPLRNRSWDLSSAKSVPSFGPDPAAAPARAAKPAAKRQSGRTEGSRRTAETQPN